MADESTATVTEEVEKVKSAPRKRKPKTVKATAEDVPGPTVEGTGEAVREDLAKLAPGRVMVEYEGEAEPVKKHREYRLELFEEGDTRVYGRQRGLAREGWEFPVVHGFQRNLTMNRGTDRFFIVVASRDLEVPE